MLTKEMVEHTNNKGVVCCNSGKTVKATEGQHSIFCEECKTRVNLLVLITSSSPKTAVIN